MSNLNENAAKIFDSMVRNRKDLGIDLIEFENGAELLDFGINTKGGLEAGKLFAKACLAGEGTINFSMGNQPEVNVVVDDPDVHCLGAQYAGWFIEKEDFSCMASGPGRALAEKEELFRELEISEESDIAVLCLESDQIPSEKVLDYIAEECGVGPENLKILVAPTSSIVGSVQISSRVVESAIHKLHILDFEVESVISGIGRAPIAPVADDFLEAMGRTNDCTLYGGEVTLYLDSEDRLIDEIIEKVPSSASEDYGLPFRKIFEKYDNDFLEIDRELFSPARVILNNVNSGSVFEAGSVNEEILEKSFED